MSRKLARIKYSKEFPATMLGHLDTINSLQRAIRRSLWPFELTKGFNTRIKNSFSPSLSLGIASDVEYLEVFLRRSLSDFHIEAMREAVLEGITIKDIIVLPYDSVSINDNISGFVYKVDFIEGSETVFLSGEGIERTGDGTYKLTVKKENGGFKNPKKIIGDGVYSLRKTECIFSKEEKL